MIICTKYSKNNVTKPLILCWKNLLTEKWLESNEERKTGLVS